ncbi:gp045 [Rhodococcus phage ReqiPepy6]|uniref:Gp045 n=1 Tax=Rhodococcus phage ReqiPepy6 TaxID=691965 RepID=D4P7F6_9CAUD|nr:gp045 [Rhodococcus phage ReqiPepy6]ADD80936.1 gp045 [Rhodococcus phage ReqiPepy6]
MNKIHLALAAGTFVVAGIAAVNYAHISREEKAKRAEIKKNQELDIQAINLAAERMKEKLNDGVHFESIYDLFRDLGDEINFQKIAVRIED